MLLYECLFSFSSKIERLTIVLEVIFLKPAILLQSDFSLTWGAVASMKGVIKTVDPELEIIDICHDIPKFNTFVASYFLRQVLPYWPANTIAVSVVDPGVGTPRKAAIAKMHGGQIVITPDNGTLTHMKKHVGSVREIDDSFDLRGAGSVFDGRDKFAYVAALLASGQKKFEEIGHEYDISEIIECEEYSIQPKLEKNKVQGFVMMENKHFGGIEFNIKNRDFDNCDFNFGDHVQIVITREKHVVYHDIVEYNKAFGFVPIGKPILYPGSSGFMSLDVNQGSLLDKYPLIDMGKEYEVIITKDKDD